MPAPTSEVSIGDTVDIIKRLMGSDIEVITDEVRLRPQRVKSTVCGVIIQNSKH